LLCAFTFNFSLVNAHSKINEYTFMYIIVPVEDIFTPNNIRNNIFYKNNISLIYSTLTIDLSEIFKNKEKWENIQNSIS